MKELIILGCGGHAKSIASVAIRSDIRLQCFYDDSARDNEVILGIPVLKPIVGFSGNVIVGVGDNLKRSNCFNSYHDVAWVNVISKFADISTNLKIGVGNFISSMCYIGPDVTIADNCIINTGAIIEHDVKIGSHSHISIGAKIAGKVTIGDYCFLGAGSVVIDGISIVDNVIVGAGSVVVENILESGTYVGVPARKIR